MQAKAENCRIETAQEGDVTFLEVERKYMIDDKGLIYKTYPGSTFRAGKPGDFLMLTLKGTPQELKAAQDALDKNSETQILVKSIVYDEESHKKKLQVLAPQSGDINYGCGYNMPSSLSELVVLVSRALGNLRIVITPEVIEESKGNFVPAFSFKSTHSPNPDINKLIRKEFDLSKVEGISHCELGEQWKVLARKQVTHDRASAKRLAQELVAKAIDELGIGKEDIAKGRAL